AGDRLYLCSDGVPEAMDPAGKQFGDARLLEAIDHGRSESLREGVAALLGEIARWHGFVKFQDDITILAIEALTSVDVASVGADSLPLQFSIRQSSPNPFQENTSARYSLPR